MDNRTEIADKLSSAWPGREVQIRSLVGLLGTGLETVPTLLVHGSAATGKTQLVKAILTGLNIPFGYASCLTSSTPPVLFEALLAGVSQQGSGLKSGSLTRSISKVGEFIRSVRKIGKTIREDRAMCFVVDEAERLRDRTSGGIGSLKEPLLPVFLRLAELSNQKVVVIFISRLQPEAFTGTALRQNLLSVYFPPYDDEILKTVLLKERPPLVDPSKYIAFLHPVISILGKSCRSITELRPVLHAMWQRYIEPENTHSEPLDSHVLWNMLVASLGGNFAPSIAVPLYAIEALKGPDRAPGETAAGGNRPRPDRRPIERIDFELPYMSKLLLLASYVAARTPAALDKHVFSRRDDPAEKPTKKRKTVNGVGIADRRANQAREQHLAGPGSFHMERLVAIFRCIATNAAEHLGDVQEAALLSSSVFTQITSLVSLSLLSTNGVDMLDPGCHYYCNIGDHLAHRIAQNVAIPLSNYVIYA